jgi:tetratricopeptide (TPR) repeat protein
LTNLHRFTVCVAAVGLWLATAEAKSSSTKSKRVAPAAARIDRTVNQLLAQSDVFWHEGDFESVRWCYSVITDIDPKYVEGWQNYGWLLWSALDRDDAAMRVFLRGLEYNPEPYDLYFEIGNLEYHRRHFLSAAQWMAKATARKGAPFTAWHMRAHCLEYAGQTQKAKAVWKTIIAKFPDDPPAKINLKRLEEGRVRLNPVIGVEAPKTDKPLKDNKPDDRVPFTMDPSSI